MKADQCDNCQFFKQYPWTHIAGTCRRYPPQVISVLSSAKYPDDIQNSEVESKQPTVENTDWCGEYKKL